MDTSHGDQPHPPGPGPGGPGPAYPPGRPQILPHGPQAAPGPVPAAPPTASEPPGGASSTTFSPDAGPDAEAQAFAPPNGLPWARLSARFTLHRRVSVLVGAVPVAVIGGFLISRVTGAVGTLLWVLAVAISCGLGWIIAELAHRSWGYAERDDDLLVVQGVFVKRLVVVPYGRMQFVDVTAGLLEQWMGIATVRLHTAAAATDARIPGLPAAEAALLRDRLTHKGEARSMGL
jgi:membrane protein YdbS with pleckstrin-like domain